MRDCNEGSCSAAPVTAPEKWSHEAIIARSNMRPVRREKLNRAVNSGENPGFDFLLSCWNDDPALVIAIKKLLAKFPQWGGLQLVMGSCLAIKNRMDIFPNGEVISCKFFPEFSVGDIKTESVNDVWHGCKFTKVRETIDREGLMPVCSKCNLLYSRGI